MLLVSIRSIQGHARCLSSTLGLSGWDQNSPLAGARSQNRAEVARVADGQQGVAVAVEAPPKGSVRPESPVSPLQGFWPHLKWSGVEVGSF